MPRKASNEAIGFTVSGLSSPPLPSRGKREQRYPIKGATGLCLVVFSTGRRSLCFYKSVDGRPKSQKIGEFMPGVSTAGDVDALKRKAFKVLADVTAGETVKSAFRSAAQMPSLEEAFERFLVERRTKRGGRPLSPDTVRGYRSIFNNHLVGWSRRKLDQISLSDVKELYAAIGYGRHHAAMTEDASTDPAPTQANRTIAMLSSLYNWASIPEVGYPKIPANPAVWDSGTTTAAAKFQDVKRTRVLTRDELDRFFGEIDMLSPRMRDFLLVCLFTGMRKSNVLAMRWADVDLSAGTWTIPEARPNAALLRGKTAKAGDEIKVHLHADLVELLHARQAITAESPWVFPGNGKTGHLVEPKKQFSRLLRLAAIEHVRVHDLRHTFATYQLASGAHLKTIGTSLGHKTIQSTERYTHAAHDLVADSVDAGISAMKGESTGRKR